MTKLNAPKHLSFRPFLIYAGTLDSQVATSDIFDRLLPFEDLLEGFQEKVILLSCAYPLKGLISRDRNPRLRFFVVAP